MGVDIYGRKYAALDVNGQIQLLDKWKDVKNKLRYLIK